jgi:ribonuclease BN (tRNA processing enzyme)
VQAAQVGLDGEAGSLILTHILDAHDPAAALEAARGVFPGAVALAEPSLVVDLGLAA